MNRRLPHATEPIFSRAIRTPDGVWHVVSLQTSYWDCLDWLTENGGETIEKIIDFNWRYVQEHPGQDFGAALENYIHVRMMQHLARCHNLANDNYFDPNHDWRHPYRIKLEKKLSFCAG